MTIRRHLARGPLALPAFALLLAGCAGPSNTEPEATGPETGTVVEEGPLGCPTDGSHAIVFSGTAGTAVGGVGANTEQVHEFEIPDGCPISLARFRVEWDLAAEDLDLALEYDGEEIGSSGEFNALGTAAEEIAISDPKPGLYRLIVRSYANVETAYRGSTELLGPLECQPGKGKPAEIESGLAARLAAAADDELFEVVVTWHGSRPITNAQRAWLAGLGVRGYWFEYLPITGLLATKAQIMALRDNPDVRSIWPNYAQQGEDIQARTLSSSDQAEAEPALFDADGLPYDGSGVTIMVNDSGIDATHPDLLWGRKTLANALGHVDLCSVTGLLPFHPQDDVPHTDLLGSHGTHVAGIAAGDGTASGGKYRGAAPGATLAGYGTGAALLVLDTTSAFDHALRLRDTRPELNLRIVTNSFGTTSDQGTPFNPNDPTAVATKELVDNGFVIVFSAGNQGSGPDSITGNYKKAPWVLLAAAGNKDGLLAGYSSRGALTGGEYEVQVGCERYTVTDRPNIVTTGTDYISARAISADPVGHLNWPFDATSDDVEPQYKPYYTQNSGTSMAAPHAAGLAAVLLQANPELNWQDVISILETTATNLPGYEPWEAGAGHANIEAALAMATGKRSDYGLNNHLRNPAKARIELGESTRETVTVDFSPVGPTGSHQFEVSEGVSLVSASWTLPTGSACTCALVLIDPDGNRYGSSIALPLLAPRISAIAPGKAGTWTLTVRGIGSISGVPVDPVGVTNGVSGPESLDVTIEQIRSGRRIGMADVDGHPAVGFLEKAVIERLIDGDGTGLSPDAALTRGDFAKYLMAWGIRQTRNHDGAAVFTDIGDPAVAAAAEALTRPGAAIMDLDPASAPVLPISGPLFSPQAPVRRDLAAYALVQAAGRAAVAATYDPDAMFALDEDGNAVPLADADRIPAELRGHVQDAIVRGVLDVRFSADGSQAFVDPDHTITRAEWAQIAVRAFMAVPFDT